MSYSLVSNLTGLLQCQKALAMHNLMQAPEHLNGAVLVVCFYGTPGVPGGGSIIGEEASRLGFSGSSFPLAVAMLRTVRLILEISYHPHSHSSQV